MDSTARRCSGILLVLLSVGICHGTNQEVQSAPQPASNCTEENLMQDFDAEHRDIVKTIYPGNTKERLQQLCEDLPGATAVANSYKVGCNDSVLDERFLRLEAEGFIQGWDFFCEEGMQVYLDNRKCFENATLLKASKECDDAYSEQTWFLTYRDPNALDKHPEYCRAKDKYMSCVKRVVEEYCGEVPAQLQYDIHYNQQEPYFEGIACDIGGHLSAGAIAIISICGAAGVYTVIFVIIALGKHSRDKKRLKNKDNNGDKKKSSSNSIADKQSKNSGANKV